MTIDPAYANLALALKGTTIEPDTLVQILTMLIKASQNGHWLVVVAGLDPVESVVSTFAHGLPDPKSAEMESLLAQVFANAKKIIQTRAEVGPGGLLVSGAGAVQAVQNLPPPEALKKLIPGVK